MNPYEALSPTTAADRSLNDERVETLLVHLFGRLEQQMNSLESTDSIKRMVKMIETALGMLVTIIDTGVENFDVGFFAHELPSVWRLRERSKVVLHVLDREGWTNVFGLSPKANNATLMMHRNLGKNFGQSFRDLFARFGEEFESQRLRDEWRESCEVLVTDFVQRW